MIALKYSGGERLLQMKQSVGRGRDSWESLYWTLPG